MKQEIDILQECSAYEIIMIIHELHQLGYEQLRLQAGLSPSGMSWRWRIYPKVLMGDYNEFERDGEYVPFKGIFGSTGYGMPKSRNLVKAEDLLRYYPDYFKLAKGEDKEYVNWFQTIVNHAQNGDFPISYAEFYSAEEWKFLSSKESLSYPPFTPASIDDIPKELMKEYIRHKR